MNMTEEQAATKADDIIKLLIQHQPELLGKYPVGTESSAAETAKALARLRSELIAQLQSQPL